MIALQFSRESYTGLSGLTSMDEQKRLLMNALSPMYVTLLGMYILDSDDPQNASSPMRRIPSTMVDWPQPVTRLSSLVRMIALQCSRESNHLFFGETVISLSPSQPLNTQWPISRMLDEKCSFCRLEQPSSAKSPRDSSDSGRDRYLSPEQYLNAPLSILLTPSGIVKLSRYRRPMNAHWPMVVTPLGIFVLWQPSTSVLSAVLMTASQWSRESNVSLSLFTIISSTLEQKANEVAFRQYNDEGRWMLFRLAHLRNAPSCMPLIPSLIIRCLISKWLQKASLSMSLIS